MSCDYVNRLLTDSLPKCCIFYPIPSTLVCCSTNKIVSLITHHVNLSLLSSKFPETCKLSGCDSPTPKKCDLDRNVMKNYRPVSNLSFFFSKIIEKSACDQLSSFLTVNDVYTNC